MTPRLRRVAAVASLLLVLACGEDGEGENIPAGSYAGSTEAGREFTLEIGDRIEVNDQEARFVDVGVLQIRELGDAMQVTCSVTDPDGEELRCTVETEVPDGPPTTEVIDLMLL